MLLIKTVVVSMDEQSLDDKYEISVMGEVLTDLEILGLLSPTRKFDDIKYFTKIDIYNTVSNLYTPEKLKALIDLFEKMKHVERIIDLIPPKYSGVDMFNKLLEKENGWEKIGKDYLKKKLPEITDEIKDGDRIPLENYGKKMLEAKNQKKKIKKLRKTKKRKDTKNT
jgi:nucleoid DNA-binding protein